MLIRKSDYESYGFDPSDESIGSKLEAVEASIRSVTNNRFHVRACRVEAASSQGSLCGVPLGVGDGDTVEITSSGANDGLYVVEAVDGKRLSLDRPLLDAPFNRCTLVRYPSDVVRGAVGILEYEKAIAGKKGVVASESLSRHSVTYQQGGSLFAGYPAEITAFMKPYMNARF